MLCRRLKVRRILKKNPLKNSRVMAKLNPYAGVQKKAARLVQEKRKAEKQQKLDAQRGVSGWIVTFLLRVWLCHVHIFMCFIAIQCLYVLQLTDCHNSACTGWQGSSAHDHCCCCRREERQGQKMTEVTICRRPTCSADLVL